MTNIAAIVGLFPPSSASTATIGKSQVGFVIRGRFPYDFYKQYPELVDAQLMAVLADVEHDPKWGPIFRGDLTAHNGNHSRADLAMCGEFMRRGLSAFATDTAMRASALYREKWERDDYRSMTLRKAQPAISTADVGSPPRSSPSLDITRAHLPISTAAPPPRDWFYSGMLVPGKSAVLAGFGGSSKTQLALHLAVATALGQSFAGRSIKHGSSLLICGEEDGAELARRMNAIVRYDKLTSAQAALIQQRIYAFPMEGEDIRLTRKEKYGELVTTDFLQEITRIASQIDDLRLIVMDHAALLHGGEFNAKEDVTFTMRAINMIAKKTGAAVLVLAHAPKSASNLEESDASMVAGSTAFVDHARAAWILSTMRKGEATTHKIAHANRREYVSLKVVKSNHGPSEDVFWFRRHSFDDVGLLEHILLVPPLPTSNATAALRTSILHIVRAQPGAYSRTSLRDTYSGKGVRWALASRMSTRLWTTC